MEDHQNGALHVQYANGALGFSEEKPSPYSDFFIMIKKLLLYEQQEKEVKGIKRKKS
jgi:hypothetical protein